MVYENVVKKNGPYQGKDSRLRLILTYNDSHKQTISYPRYVMENYLGRYLSSTEQIDHIDGNPLNNDISNLQILPIKVHQQLDANRNKDAIAVCKYCGKEFLIEGKTLSNRNRKDRHQSGYFCSRRCSGKYGVEIQLGLRNHRKEDKIVSETYKVKSAQGETFEVEVG